MAINNLLNQTVTIYNQTGLDKFGKASVGSGATHQSRMQVGRKTRLLPNQEVMIIDAICFLKPNVTVSRDDKISFEGVDYKVMAIKKSIGGNGATHHLELELQKWQTA